MQTDSRWLLIGSTHCQLLIALPTGAQILLANSDHVTIESADIVTNTIQISSLYHHDMVLTVFCLSGIISVPILAIFTKALMLKSN
jgi:hypothetical protein